MAPAPADPRPEVSLPGPSLREALRWAVGFLAQSGSASPRLDAELLLAHVLGWERTQLYLRSEDLLAPAAARRFTELVRRRAAHEPVAYLLGRRAFYDLDLAVGPEVLIPRPETELLVEEALAWAKPLARPLNIVDVGTGSGAIALALARHLPQARVWAVDLSLAALRVAAANARRYGLEERVLLLCGDLLAPLAGPFDLIAANLPYIAHDRLAALPPDVAAYEPPLALDGGVDGLALIRRLLDQAPARLARPGLVVLELDQGQGEAVTALARAHWPQAEVTVRRDYAGLERMVRIAIPAP
jgi:release factor glutamine methyltransferase